MNKKKNESYLVYFICIILFVNLITTILLNLDQLDTILILSVILVGLFIYNELFIVSEPKRWYGFWFVLTIIIFILILIILFYNFNTVRVFLYIVLYQMYKKRLRISYLFFNGVIFIGYLYFILYNEMNTRIIVETIAIEFTLFVLVNTIIVLLFHIINQNEKLEKIQHELVLKNCELENTHHHLQSAYNQLEEYTIIKERGKIARELHDTVGHTLTTALVELEVSQLLFEQDKALSKSKLLGAIEQVRKGLSDLRTSVKTLKEDVNYISEIEDLLETTTKHTAIKIKTEVNDLGLIKDRKTLGCIYRILQEGITNGLKHGRATAFIFQVHVVEHIKIYLSNNGKGSTVFSYGFGINAMEERVKELGGQIDFDFGKEDGFGIKVVLPMKRSDVND